jgi:hypothetical protein
VLLEQMMEAVGNINHYVQYYSRHMHDYCLSVILLQMLEEVRNKYLILVADDLEQ